MRSSAWLALFGIHTSSVTGAATAAIASSASQALLLTALPADHVRDAREHGETRTDRRRLVADLAAAAAVVVVAVDPAIGARGAGGGEQEGERQDGPHEA